MAYVLALCAIAFWSTNAVTAKFVLQGLPVEQIQFLQFLGATCVFAFLRYGSTAKGKQNRVGITAWILGTVGLTGTMIFQYIGFDIGPITEANIIAYAWPLFAVFFVVLSGTTPRPILLLTLAVIGFLGAGLVIGGNEWSNLSFATSPYGFMAAALSAVCMAVYTFGIGQTKNQPLRVRQTQEAFTCN